LFDIINKVKPKIVYNSDFVLLSGITFRKTVDFDKWWVANQFGNLTALRAMTSVAGELAALTGPMNPYPEGKLGVIEEGAYADILIVDGNPLENITVIGANPKWFDAEPRDQDIPTIRIIMKDGVIYKNTL
jgi:imidazolonepropionase-like amidohydrolase